MTLLDAPAPPGPAPSAPAPTTSVVICAYTDDRWDLLVEAVASVERQRHPALEVVLVIDHNAELLARSVARWPEHVVVPNRHGRGLSGARNTGVEVAAGDLVGFLDDDAAADPDWLGRLVALFADEAVGGAGGAVVPRWLHTPPRWFPEEFLWVVGCSYRGLPEQTTTVRNPIGASMVFRRSVLLGSGGFNEAVGRVGTKPVGCEETELSLRAGALGYRVLYEPSAVVHHTVPAGRANVRYFIDRCRAEGRSKAVVSRLVRDVGGPSGALATEQAYVKRVLPRGVLGSAASAVMIVVGLVATASGYVEARLRRATTALAEPAADTAGHEVAA